MAVDRLDERHAGRRAELARRSRRGDHEANLEIYEGSIDDADQAGMGTTVTAVAVVTDTARRRGVRRRQRRRLPQLRAPPRPAPAAHDRPQLRPGARRRRGDHPRRGPDPPPSQHRHPCPRHRALRAGRLVDDADHPRRPLRAVQRRARRRGHRRRRSAEILHTHVDDPGAAAQALVDAANDAGGRDNITVVIVDVLEGDDPPDPTAEFDVVPLWSDDDDETGESEIVSDPPDDELAGQAPTLYDGGDDVTPVPGAAVPIVEPATAASADAADAAGDATAPKPRRKRLAGLGPVRARARSRRGADPRLRDPRGVGSLRVFRRLRRGRPGRHLPGPSGQRFVVRSDTGPFGPRTRRTRRPISSSWSREQPRLLVAGERGALRLRTTHTHHDDGARRMRLRPLRRVLRVE